MTKGELELTSFKEDPELTAQQQIDLNTASSIGTMIGQMIASTLPEPMRFALMIFKPGEDEVRCITCDGPPKETVALLRFYADSIEERVPGIEEHLAEIEVLNAVEEAKGEVQH